MMKPKAAQSDFVLRRRPVMFEDRAALEAPLAFVGVVESAVGTGFHGFPCVTILSKW
jgi:hypothetical protein